MDRSIARGSTVSWITSNRLQLRRHSIAPAGVGCKAMLDRGFHQIPESGLFIIHTESLLPLTYAPEAHRIRAYGANPRCRWGWAGRRRRECRLRPLASAHRPAGFLIAPSPLASSAALSFRFLAPFGGGRVIRVRHSSTD